MGRSQPAPYRQTDTSTCRKEGAIVLRRKVGSTWMMPVAKAKTRRASTRSSFEVRCFRYSSRTLP